MSINPLAAPVPSEALKAKFRSGDQRATVDIRLGMHGGEPPVTWKTTNVDPVPSSYPISVGEDGAAAYFPFEETTGTQAFDAVTAANYGTYAPSAVHIVGEIQNELPFTANAISTTVADSVVAGSPILPGPGSLEFWMRTVEVVGVTTVIGYLTTNLDAATPPPVTTTKISLTPTGTIAVAVHDAADALLYSDFHPTAVNDGAWHHIVAVDTGSAITVYRDGSTT